MLKNYIKIAWRNLTSNKGFSFINIIGLSIGVAACVLIAVYVLHESSYDKDVPNSSNVYRLNNHFLMDDGIFEGGLHLSANAAQTVLEDFAEVENSGRLMDNGLFWGAGTNELRFDGEQMQHHEKGFTYADQSMIDILGIAMVYGDASTALSEPNTIVISEDISKKYFKDKNPIGRTIFLNGKNDRPFLINGVMENFASNSHLDYNFLITLKDVEFGEGEQTRWTQNNYFIYLVLRPNTDVGIFEKKLSNTLINKYFIPAMKSAGYGLPENIEEKYYLSLQPLADINLYSTHINFEASFRNDIKIIWIFGIVALFILIIASINFINLSTAKSANRAKEVGMRKVTGSTRSQLIAQFLMESAIITIIAFGIGVLLSALLMPLFREMTGKDLELPFSNLAFVPIIFMMAIVVGILAGLYPAFYLSNFNPINVLKGKIRMGSRSGGLRSSLVVFQFTISIILIVGTLIVNQQLNFILQSKIGFDKDQVIQLYGTNMLENKVGTFKEEIKNLPGVSSVSISDFLPIEGTKRNGNSFVNEGKENIDETVGGQAWVIDEDYLATLGMKLLEGRNFIKDRASDKEATIINQAMADKLNLDEPIGKRISRSGSLYEIIGVVEDFNFNTMKESVQPLCFFQGISPSIISVKINSSDVSGILVAIGNSWSEFVPNMEFRYEFMDATFANMYDNVSRIKSIFTTFAVLAIFVACLGLFALSSYMVEQRKKELSIRKVLGASIQNIFRIVAQNFLLLVFISIFIGGPIAFYIMDIWLTDYAYRIDISWSVFAWSGATLFMIALTTISYHVFRSAIENPIKNLRSE